MGALFAELEGKAKEYGDYRVVSVFIGGGTPSVVESKWIAELLEKVIAFFTNFNALFAVEIVLFFFIIFFVSKVLRDNDATKLMLLYWVLLIAGGAMHIFDGEVMTKEFFMFYTVILSSVMLIIFSVEVKKYFWDVQRKKPRAIRKRTAKRTANVVSQTSSRRCRICPKTTWARSSCFRAAACPSRFCKVAL